MAIARVRRIHSTSVLVYVTTEIQMDIPSGLTEDEADAYVQENHARELRNSGYGDLIDTEYRPQDSELYPDCEFDAVYLEEYISEGEEESEDENEDGGDDGDDEILSLSENIDQKLDGIKFNMIPCPAGEFWMGSEDGVGYNDERPRHKVKMSKAFWMGETQVTQELWEKVMGWNPSYFKGSNQLPVECVTWYDCLVFCNKLSKLEGLNPCFKLTKIKKDEKSITKANVEWLRNANGYRLPTEAEWEYCAKAGTELTYSGSNNIDEVAWYYENAGNHRLKDSEWDYDKLLSNQNKTHGVKSKKANAWGLYDMSGNVWEWCMDQWDENAYKSRNNGIENPTLWDNLPCARVVRGGSSGDNADVCRVANRDGYDADFRYDFQGLRLLRCEP